jgi:hypothetical protein
LFSFLGNRSNVELQKYLEEHGPSSFEIPAINFIGGSLNDFLPETFFDYDEASGTSTTRNELVAMRSSKRFSCEGKGSSERHLLPGTSNTNSER